MVLNFLGPIFLVLKNVIYLMSQQQDLNAVKPSLDHSLFVFWGWTWGEGQM